MKRYTEKQVQEMNWYAHYSKRLRGIRYISADSKESVIFYPHETDAPVYVAKGFTRIVLSVMKKTWRKPFDYEEIMNERKTHKRG